MLAIEDLSAPGNAMQYVGPHKAPLRFPEDHQFHFDAVKDWYFLVGNLVDVNDSKNRFAFVCVITSQPVMGPRLLHNGEVQKDSVILTVMTTITAVTPTLNQTFMMPPVSIAASDSSVVLENSPWTVEIGNVIQWISASTDPNNLFPMQASIADPANQNLVALQLTSAQPILLQGEKGVAGWPAAGLGWNYYSYSNLPAQGIVAVQGKSFQVKGVGWFDHQWGGLGTPRSKVLQVIQSLSALNSPPPPFAGWNWFAVQMENNTQMTGAYFNAYDGYGNVPLECRQTTGVMSIQDSTGKTEFLTSSGGQTPKIIWQVLKWVTSPYTGTVYPGQWRITIPSKSIDVTLTPIRDNQIGFHPQGIEWQENACDVTGTFLGVSGLSGVGWGECVGYATQNLATSQLLMSAGVNPVTPDQLNAIQGATLRTQIAQGNNVAVWGFIVAVVIATLVFAHYARCRAKTK